MCQGVITSTISFFFLVTGNLFTWIYGEEYFPATKSKAATATTKMLHNQLSKCYLKSKMTLVYIFCYGEQEALLTQPLFICLEICHSQNWIGHLDLYKLNLPAAWIHSVQLLQNTDKCKSGIPCSDLTAINFTTDVRFAHSLNSSPVICFTVSTILRHSKTLILPLRKLNYGVKSISSISLI